MNITKNYKKAGIYCIINIISKKKYIGSSINMYQRLLKHRSLLRKNKHQNRKLQNSWNKNLESSFDFYILEFCEISQLEIREQFYIDTLSPEYNITLIVERNILSPESRILQSNTRKERIKSGQIKLCEKIIYQYDLQGNFIKKHEGIKKACEEVGIHQSTICRFLKGTYNKAGNFLWALTFEKKLKPYEKLYKSSGKFKSVQLLDFNTKQLILEFKSLQECAKYFKTHPSSLSEAIKNKRQFRKKYMVIIKPA